MDNQPPIQTAAEFSSKSRPRASTMPSSINATNALNGDALDADSLNEHLESLTVPSPSSSDHPVITSPGSSALLRVHTRHGRSASSVSVNGRHKHSNSSDHGHFKKHSLSRKTQLDKMIRSPMNDIDEDEDDDDDDDEDLDGLEEHRDVQRRKNSQSKNKPQQRQWAPLSPIIHSAEDEQIEMSRIIHTVSSPERISSDQNRDTRIFIESPSPNNNGPLNSNSMFSSSPSTPFASTSTLINNNSYPSSPIHHHSNNVYQNHLRFTNSDNAHANPTNEEDEDDNDDARSVLEETEQENPYISQALNSGRYSSQNAEDHPVLHFVSIWLKSLLLHLLFIAIFLAPGIICDKFTASQCHVFGTPLLKFSEMFTVCIAGHFLAGVAVAATLIAIRRTPFLGRHFVYYVINLNRPLKWALVAITIQITWPVVFFDTEVFKQTYGALIDSFIGCCTLTAFAFLVKAIGMRFIAVRFHRGAYYKRIRGVLMSEFVVTTLLTGPGRLAEQERKERVERKAAEKGMRISHPHKSQVHRKFETVVNDVLGRGAVFSTKTLNGTMSLTTDVFHFDTLAMSEQELCDRRPFSNHKLAVFVEYVRESDFSFGKGVFRRFLLADQPEGVLVKTGRDGVPDFDETKEAGERIDEMTSSQQARCLSKILYTQMLGLASGEKRNNAGNEESVYLEDFMKILSPVMAAHGFALFDGNWDGSLSENEFYTTLMAISRERKALRTALNDAESAIAKLDDAIAGVIIIVLVVAYFMIFRVDPNKVLLTVSSFLLATAFAIGSSAKALLESIIFLFVTHPFDIGDRIVLKGVVYTVSKMNLLTTVLKRFDNAILYFSNAYLSTEPLVNLRRSPDQFDIIKIQISFHTPVQVLRAMEQRLASYIQKQSAHFYRKFEVEYREIENTNRLSLHIWAQHRSNFQNMRRMRERRGRLVLRLKKICQELGVEYEMPAQRVIHDGLPNVDEHNMSPQVVQEELMAGAAAASVAMNSLRQRGQGPLQQSKLT